MLEFVQSKCQLGHLLLGGVVSMELTSDVKQHHHNYVEIFVIISGSAVHVVNGKREGCYPGYVSVINVGCNHGFEKVNNLNVINLSCTPDLFERLNFNFALLNGKEMVFQGNKLYSTIKFKGMLFYEVKNLLANMLEIFQNLEDKDREAKLRIYLGIFLTILLQNYKKSENISIMQLEEIANYMDSHYADNITLESLVKRSGMCRSLFISKFKENFGLTPIKYLNDIRMNNACELLFNTDMQIKEIAIKCGFYDGNYFIKLYKEHFGVAPATNRRNLYKEI